MTNRELALQDALIWALECWQDHNESGDPMQAPWAYDARAALAMPSPERAGWEAVIEALENMCKSDFVRVMTSAGSPNYDGQKWVHWSHWVDLRARIKSCLALAKAIPTSAMPASDQASWEAGPETLDLLAFRLRNMADSMSMDQIDADRINRAAAIVDSIRSLRPPEDAP
jgi:hypothetical protein